MAPYEVLTFHMLNEYLPEFSEKQKKDAVEEFARNFFLEHLKGLHEGIMEIDVSMKKFEKFAFKARDSFKWIVSEEMRDLVYDQYAMTTPSKREKLVDVHLRFLQKCVILKKELEHYLKRPIVGVDVKAQLSEFKKKFGIVDIEKDSQCNTSCSTCNIF